MPIPSGPQEVTGTAEYRRLIALLDERRFDEALVRTRLLLENPDLHASIAARAHNLACWLHLEGLKRPCPEAVLHGREAVRLFRKLRLHRLACEAMINLASAHHQLGEWPAADQCNRRALALLRRHPDALPFGRIVVFAALGCTAYSARRYRMALRYLSRAECLCTREEDRFLLYDIWRRRSLVLLEMGAVTEATAWLDRIQAEVDPGRHSLWWRTRYRVARARLEVARCNWHQARGFIQNTLAQAQEHDDLPALAECWCLLAQIDQGEGRRDARRRARQALNYAIASGRRDVVRMVRERLRPLLGPGEDA